MQGAQTVRQDKRFAWRLGEVFVLNYEVSMNLKLSHEFKEAFQKCLNMNEIYETHILHQSKVFVMSFL